MDIPQKIREYFSPYDWNVWVRYLMTGYQHEISPTTQQRPQGSGTILASSVLLGYRQRIQDPCWHIWDEYYNEAALNKLLNKGYCNVQRFVVLFGLWWGLWPEQLRRCADLRNRGNCLHWLNYFLCNPQATGAGLTKEVLHSFSYTGSYVSIPPIRYVCPETEEMNEALQNNVKKTA